MLEADWRSEMAAGREPITQRLGRAGHAAGLEGLLVRSAADRRGMNLLIFPGNIRVSSRVEMLDAGKPPS